MPARPVHPPADKRRPRRIDPLALDWECIRERARRANRSVSAYVRDRVAAHDAGARDTGAAAEPSADDWEALIGRLREAFERLAPVPKEAPKPGMSESATFLFNARIDELTRLGRDRDLAKLLGKVFEPERARAIARAAKARSSG